MTPSSRCSSEVKEVTTHGSTTGRTRLDRVLDAAAVHLHTDQHRRRVDQARRIAETLPDRPVVAFSGGKDSTVAAHLTITARPDTICVHIDSGIDLPETHRHIDHLRNAGWDIRSAVKDSLEVMVRHGGWDHTAPDGDVTADQDGWYHPVEAEARRRDWTVVWGIRAAESRRRAAQMQSTRGVHTRRDGITTVSPAWRFDDIDVWAYHLANDLPINGVYRRLAEIGAPPGAWRVDAAVSSRGMRHGRYVWLRRGWPDLWEQLCETIPRLREIS